MDLPEEPDEPVDSHVTDEDNDDEDVPLAPTDPIPDEGDVQGAPESED